jgi:hypothetical protein
VGRDGEIYTIDLGAVKSIISEIQKYFSVTVPAASWFETREVALLTMRI